MSFPFLKSVFIALYCALISTIGHNYWQWRSDGGQGQIPREGGAKLILNILKVVIYYFGYGIFTPKILKTFCAETMCNRL